MESIQSEAVDLQPLKSYPPLLPLPPSLPDYRSNEKAWADVQALLHPRVAAEEADIDEDFLCPITQCLMRDPVTTSDGQTYEREAITQWFAAGNNTSPITNDPLEDTRVIDAIMARRMIERAITKRPQLAELQYLPSTWIIAMHEACRTGDVPAIRTWVQKDKRLLLTANKDVPMGKQEAGLAVEPVALSVPHAVKGVEGDEKDASPPVGEKLKETGVSPLHQAVHHADSLSALIELLEKRQPGLALASLLHPDSAGQLPLEHALRSAMPVSTLVNLMAWMGDALAAFQLSAPLPDQVQPVLTALLQTCLLRGNIAWIRQAIAWGADANAMASEGESLLCLAIRLGKVEAVSLLLAVGADANGKTPEGLPVLSLALHPKNPEIVKALLEARADLEVSQSALGDSALQLAIRQGDLPLTALLCEKGASLATARQDGQTALHAAAQQKDTAFLERLLAEKGASQVLNTPDAQGFTPLHYAALQGHDKAVAVLLAQKARWDVPDKEGNTVLHIAARLGSAAILELLLLAGADKDAENKVGQTPQELAESQGPHVLAAYTQASEKLAQQAAKALETQGIAGMAALLLRQQQQLEDLGRMFRLLRKELSEKEKAHAVERQGFQAQLQAQEKKLGDQQEQLQRQQEAAAKQAAEVAEQSVKQKAAAEGLEKVNAKAEQTEKQQAEQSAKAQAEEQKKAEEAAEAAQRAAYALEQERKAAAAAERQARLLPLQNDLVIACEQGDEKAVEALLLKGADPSLENKEGKHPLGAAVWGMNPEVVNRLIAAMGGVASMSWEECEAHNRRHYKEVFMFAQFAPTTCPEWHILLLKMNRSPFLAAKHLAEVTKLWPHELSSSWEKFVPYIGGSARDAWNGYYSCCTATNNYHTQLVDSITQVLRNRDQRPK